MTNRFTLHGMFMSGPSYKVALALSLMGEKYTYNHVNLRNGEHKQAAHMSRNRYGQVPALDDGKTGMTVVQSGAILQYLAGELGSFGGDGLTEKVQVNEWLFWDFDKLAPNIYRTRGIRIGLRSLNQQAAELYFNEGNAALQQLETSLSGHEWLVGKAPTIADVDVYGVVYYAAIGGFDMKAYPSIGAWMRRIEALKGYATPESLMPVPQA